MRGARTPARLAVLAAVLSIALAVYFATRETERPTLPEPAHHAAEPNPTERVDLAGAERLANSSERSAAPSARPTAPAPTRSADQDDLDELTATPSFQLELHIEPSIDLTLQARIGVWAADPGGWLRGATHPLAWPEQLLSAATPDGLLPVALPDPSTVDLPNLPYDTPFWVSVTPEGFRTGRLEGFLPVLVAHPPVAEGAEPEERIAVELTVRGGVRGHVIADIDLRDGWVRHAPTDHTARIDRDSVFQLWPLPPGLVQLDFELALEGSVLATSIDVNVVDGELSDLGDVHLDLAALRAPPTWSGTVRDDRGEPVEGTLSVRTPAHVELARLRVDSETGDFAWRGPAPPYLQLAFQPDDEVRYAPLEHTLALPAPDPVRLTPERRDPTWIQLLLVPEPVRRNGELDWPLYSWMLEGEGLRRSGGSQVFHDTEGFEYESFSSGPIFDVGLLDTSNLGEAGAGPEPAAAVTGAGACPPGNYTVFLFLQGGRVARHRFALQANESGAHRERIPLDSREPVTARGELVLIEGAAPLARAEIELTFGELGSAHVFEERMPAAVQGLLGRRTLRAGPFTYGGLPAGPFELGFVDRVTNRLLATRRVDGAPGAIVDLGRIELRLP